MREPGPQSLRRAESANAIIELSGELLNFPTGRTGTSVTLWTFNEFPQRLQDA
jgi:hypothetical protein